MEIQDEEEDVNFCKPLSLSRFVFSASCLCYERLLFCLLEFLVLIFFLFLKRTLFLEKSWNIVLGFCSLCLEMMLGVWFCGFGSVFSFLFQCKR